MRFSYRNCYAGNGSVVVATTMKGKQNEGTLVDFFGTCSKSFSREK